jgi:hypothetical protein
VAAPVERKAPASSSHSRGPLAQDRPSGATPAAAPGQGFPAARDYSSLSVKDLLDARDTYHVHLAHLANVVATAIGRYRIRKGDWYDEHPPNVQPPADYKHPTDARTLANSVVRPWSWPCVLVFVRDWVDRVRFGGVVEPDQMVPRALYLSDGRVIPTCVVQVTEQAAPASGEQKLSFPKTLIGGGYLLSSEVQGRTHLGSVGCLVTDGSSMFALTNRHVTGEAGREIGSVLEGEPVRVGVSDANQAGKKPFSTVYPGWPGANVQSNIDAGLVRMDDVSRWTTQVVGLGPLDLPADLTTDSITLDLIGCKVRAFGGASGLLLGQIDALFYRYKSVGGTDYMADLVIGSRPPSADVADGASANTLPGDSGTLWCLEEAADAGKISLRPIALQWGGHVVVEDGDRRTTAHSYALATCLSTVCRELDVDVVRDWNTGLPEYWGDVGHYTIAAQACQRVQEKGLTDLMKNNLVRISYEDAQIRPSTFQGLSTAAFVPLADVPDKIWKMFGAGRRGAPEHPNHFADMDRKDSKGKTLLQICEDGAGGIDPAKVAIAVWQQYYDDVKDKSRGCLPFRVWQLYEAMVAAGRAGKVPDFVFAAGVMAHYVGDACQPLHISYMFDGDPDHVDPTTKKPRASGVHSAYEAKMLNSHVVDLIGKLNQKLDSGAVPRPKRVQGGHGAAVAVVELMQRTFGDLAPPDILAAFSADKDLWALFGDKTVLLMAMGSLALAVLWESAWVESGAGQKLTAADLGPVDQAALKKLYLDPTVVPSKTLNQIGDVLGKP